MRTESGGWLCEDVGDVPHDHIGHGTQGTVLLGAREACLRRGAGEEIHGSS